VKGLKLGQKASLTHTFTAAEVDAYRALTGDAGLGVGVPGPLLGGLFSQLLGTRLPGRGTNWLKQQLAFEAPAFAGEPLKATVEIVRLRPEKGLVNLRTMCINMEGAIICDGEALVLVRDVSQ
jgi:acyl dehydratase